MNKKIKMIFILLIIFILATFNMCGENDNGVNGIITEDIFEKQRQEEAEKNKEWLEKTNNSGITTKSFVHKSGSGQTWVKMNVDDTDPVYMWCTMNNIDKANVEYGVNEKGVVVELKIENQKDLTLDKVYSRWTQIYSLSIEDCDLQDISHIGNMPSLRVLNLSNNKIKDITPLSELEEITHLNLSTNLIEDITSLEKFTMMVYLDLNDNNIEDITPLKDLWNIDTLFLSHNNISNIDPLANLTNLYELRMSYNNISNIDPLAKLTELHILYLDENNISDITALFSLKKLDDLLVSENPIDLKDIRRLEKVLNLRDIF